LPGIRAAWQLTLGAQHPEVEDASLPGSAAIDSYGIAVLGTDVATIFMDEFGQDPAAPRTGRVPVKRIDFSGYGASTFSDWR
jgi:hypothetical protein